MVQLDYQTVLHSNQTLFYSKACDHRTLIVRVLSPVSNLCLSLIIKLYFVVEFDHSTVLYS